jgi:hypothetical protein
MTTIRCLYVIVILCLLPVCLYGQEKSSLQLLQGFWKQSQEDESYSSYAYYEGHSLYDIISDNGRLGVHKYYVAFFDGISEDSIALKDLKENGDRYGFIDFDDLKGRTKKIGSYSFNNYSYDLEEGSFNYYGGDPFVFYKIKSLPADLHAQFLMKKEELDRKIIFDFVPDYKRKGPNMLPYTIEATSEKVYFHTLPDDLTQQKAFIVKGQQAKVLDYKKGWYYILFDSGTSKTTGWVKEAEMK